MKYFASISCSNYKSSRSKYKNVYKSIDYYSSNADGRFVYIERATIGVDEAASLKSKRVNDMVEGNATVLIKDGKIILVPLFLSLGFESKMGTFQPKKYLDRADITLIRPMISLEETTIERFVENKSIPIVINPCSTNKKISIIYDTVHRITNGIDSLN
jgi:hypothetical protein